jgi:hypothetical protein
MARKIDHQRLTAEAFCAELSACNLSVDEFRRLTGASWNSVRSWMLPEDHPKAQEPPFWVTSWLTLFKLPGGSEAAWAVFNQDVIREADDEAA